MVCNEPSINIVIILFKSQSKVSFSEIPSLASHFGSGFHSFPLSCNLSFFGVVYYYPHPGHCKIKESRNCILFVNTVFPVLSTGLAQSRGKSTCVEHTKEWASGCVSAHLCRWMMDAACREPAPDPWWTHCGRDLWPKDTWCLEKLTVALKGSPLGTPFRQKKAHFEPRLCMSWISCYLHMNVVNSDSEL